MSMMLLDKPGDVWHVVERAQAGEAEAFGELYDRYVETVYRFVYLRTGDRHVAEDLTADTFVRALRNIRTVTWQGHDFAAWLVTIARNLVADRYKSGRYRLEVSVADMLHFDRPDDNDPAVAVVDRITRGASAAMLAVAIRQLTADQRKCLSLRFGAEYNLERTAEEMGCTVGAVKAMQYRAVRRLAELIGGAR